MYLCAMAAPVTSTIPVVTTPRLRLRAFTSEDAVPLHGIMGTEEVMRYFPTPIPPTREQIDKFIANQLKHWSEYGLGWWAIDSTASGQLVGWAGLQHLPDTNETEVAYLIAREQWGKGLAVEAALAGLTFGFDNLGRDTIIAVVHIDNVRSYRVLDKLGMIRDCRDSYFGIEVYHYTMDRTTFHQLYPTAPEIPTDCAL
jgi:RimJ/RimL family protein N-acetyltransferase